MKILEIRRVQVLITQQSNSCRAAVKSALLSIVIPPPPFPACVAWLKTSGDV